MGRKREETQNAVKRRTEEATVQEKEEKDKKRAERCEKRLVDAHAMTGILISAPPQRLLLYGVCGGSGDGLCSPCCQVWGGGETACTSTATSPSTARTHW